MSKHDDKSKKKKMKHSSNFKHNLQPPAGILNVFSRLNYKPHYALAEFVDNSTQSYLLHKQELKETELDYQLKITIRYDSDTKSLIVDDNAFGMELDRFLDAITLDAKNQDQINSRNEFGMGLKTAASWFGNVWSVSSTALGSNKRYRAIVNIPMLQDTGENEIDILIEDAPIEEHGTRIYIEQMTKGMGPRAVGKARSLLASMYRRDLATNDININVNGQDIEFDGYSVLAFRDREWRKDLDFNVEFGGRNYRVSGFVGIMNPGGFPKAGFALFRRNRVIVGGEDLNYKPREIFGQAQSQVSLKLFGELDMDDFPVNQAKDGFIWDDGLEDEFIDTLKDNIHDFIEIARMSKEERAKEEKYSDEASARVKDEVSKAIDRLNSYVDEDDGKGFPSREGDTETQISFDGTNTLEEITEAFLKDITESNKEPSDFKSPSREYIVNVDKVLNRKITVSWEMAGNEKWITVDQPNQDSDINVTINVNHRFFKPYSNEEEFQVVLEKFVIAFVIAEVQARINSDKDGHIFHNAIRNNMNEYLGKLSEG
ncbi:hypothetical protein D7W09_01180 [bacterium D16-34]|nr:hypothetical protein D7W09_01180 [bacterium D16-34]